MKDVFDKFKFKLFWSTLRNFKLLKMILIELSLINELSLIIKLQQIRLLLQLASIWKFFLL